MPYIAKGKCVYKKDGGAKVGCTKGSVKRYLAALHANVDEDIYEDIKVPIEIGDTVLGGKFKNKKIVVKKIDKNEKGDITINDKPLLRVRVIKEMINEILEEIMTDAGYKKWKRANVTLRGMKEIGQENGAGAMLGNGLYTASLSNKSLARSYGKVNFVVNGRPKNPIKFKTLNDWEIWFYNKLVYAYSKAKGKEFPDKRDFNANTTIEKEIQKLGYDGIEIVGREMVNFKPENVMYFQNEAQLIDYYENSIKPKQ